MKKENRNLTRFDTQGNARLSFDLPAKSFTWFVIEAAEK